MKKMIFCGLIVLNSFAFGQEASTTFDRARGAVNDITESNINERQASLEKIAALSGEVKNLKDQKALKNAEIGGFEIAIKAIKADIAALEDERKKLDPDSTVRKAVAKAEADLTLALKAVADAGTDAVKIAAANKLKLAACAAICSANDAMDAASKGVLALTESLRQKYKLAKEEVVSVLNAKITNIKTTSIPAVNAEIAKIDLEINAKTSEISSLRSGLREIDNIVVQRTQVVAAIQPPQPVQGAGNNEMFLQQIAQDVKDLKGQVGNVQKEQKRQGKVLASIKSDTGVTLKTVTTVAQDVKDIKTGVGNLLAANVVLAQKIDNLRMDKETAEKLVKALELFENYYKQEKNRTTDDAQLLQSISGRIDRIVQRIEQNPRSSGEYVVVPTQVGFTTRCSYRSRR